MVANPNGTYINKVALTLLSICLIGWLIYIGKDIIVPLSFAILLSVLLLPVVRFFEKNGVPKILSITIALVTSVLIIFFVVYFMGSQISSFVNDIPAIQNQLHLHFVQVQEFVLHKFGISKNQQIELINNATEKIRNGGEVYLGESILSATQTIFIIILLPIYSFLILYYRVMIRQFFLDVFDAKHEQKVTEVLYQSKSIVQNYMTGLLIELAIVAVINATGFLIIGIKYAIFLGLLSAILNVIPYIGLLIASVLCMAITLTTATNIYDVVWVGVILFVVHFVDNNFITPKVVSSKVKINALLTIIGVFIGGSLAGISGMFLSIPAVAILKVIFDLVEGLQPWGMLLGDEIPIPKKFSTFLKLKKKLTRQNLK